METAASSLPALARLADVLLDEGLRAYIEQARASQRSWDWIARDLWDRTDHQIDATGVTVKGWADRLGVEAAA